MGFTTAITAPIILLQVLGSADYAWNRLLKDAKYWPDPDTYGQATDDRVWWYIVHGLVVLAQLVLGWPLVWAAQKYKRNRLPAWLFYIFCAFSALTPLPLLLAGVSNQRENLGSGVYSASVLYNLVYLLYFANLGKGLVTTPLPKGYFSRQVAHHLLGQLAAFQWYSGYQVVVYSFRYTLTIFPTLNGALHWVALLWHFYLLFYFGSHLPRYESAIGLVEDQETKKTK
eukprot:scpid71033/ scgid18876/ 